MAAESADSAEAGNEPDWFRILPVAVVPVQASDGVILASNERFRSMFSEAEAPTRLDDLAADPEPLIALRTAVMRDDGVHECEVSAPQSAAALRRFLVCARPENSSIIIAAVADVTDRWEREREAAEMARFPEMNPGPVLRFDPDGVVVLANTAARTVFQTDDLVGHSWNDLCPGMTASHWTRIMADAEPPPIEAMLGETSILFNHVRSADNKIITAFGADTTAFRDAEHKLHERAAELSEIARFPDMNPGPVIRTDMDGKVLLANAAARSIFGPDIVDGSWLDACPSVDRDEWAEILKTGNIVSVEARIGDQDFMFAHRIDPKSELVFVFGADVSDEKRAQSALYQSERMATLGTLAAGVAHELNNPAAATRRAAEQLRDAFVRLEEAYLIRDQVTFSAAASAMLVEFEQKARAAAGKPDELDGLARSDRESAIEEWLDAREVQDSWRIAPALVAAEIDETLLERAAANMEGAALNAVLAWVGAAYPVHALAYEVGQGSSRISEIVGALKSYSYLGQAPVQAVDVREGLNNTLIILRSKLKEGVTVTREFSENLGEVLAYGSELNQVWTNLLDNALDAMGGQGAITVRTRGDGKWAVVEIEDDGPGIPSEVLPRIFDPFFTTKEPGKGTGIGLSTSYSIVTEKHGGRMTVESRPGCTRFVVCLPLDTPADPSSQLAE